MTVPFHTKVSLAGIKSEDSNRTFLISGTVTDADVGKAVSLDTTAANTVKLAADGDTIIGRLEVYETRGTCTIQLNFTDPLPIKGGATVNIGDTVVGGGAGTVRSATTANPSVNFVAEVVSGFAIVVQH